MRNGPQAFLFVDFRRVDGGPGPPGDQPRAAARLFERIGAPSSGRLLVRQAQLPPIFVGGATGLNCLQLMPLGHEVREQDPEQTPSHGDCNPGKHDL